MKKLILIDASSLSNAGCLRKFYLSNVCGYSAIGVSSVSIEYGSAFHIFKQILKQHRNVELAIACAQNYFKNTPFKQDKTKAWMNVIHLTEACLAYTEKFGIDHQHDNADSVVVDGNPLVEQTVSIPYLSTEYVDVLLMATIDDILKVRGGGCYIIEDTKTTGAWNHREFFQGFELSHQLMFYRLIISWLAKHDKNPDSIFKEMSRSRIGCCINAVFLSSSKPTEFERSPIMFYSDEMINEFESMLQVFIGKLLTYVKFNEFSKELLPPREGILTQACKGLYFEPCPFASCCAASDDIVFQHKLNAGFEVRPYNPLKFRSLTPEIESMIEGWKSTQPHE